MGWARVFASSRKNQGRLWNWIHAKILEGVAAATTKSLSMDYMSSHPSTKHGNNFVFIIIKKFYKISILEDCKKSITSKSTAKIFFEQVCSEVHCGQASSHCWIPSSVSSWPSTPKLIAKQRSSIGWLCTSHACKKWIIHAHGMKGSPISSTTKIELSTTQLATTPFRWDWDSSQYVPLMFP